ncbi:MAG: DUF3194 domain-containing protein [Candidatus Bathyarchaeota archaeon]|nr:DUF3194 domain-containing protein [Candidatus Bathyarchaeota archaeon]
MGERTKSSLSDKQMERVCEIAEEAARRHIVSRVPSRRISDLSISVDLEESENFNIEVDVELTLSPLFKGVNAKKLAEESVQAAFEAVEKCLRESKCRSRR